MKQSSGCAVRKKKTKNDMHMHVFLYSYLCVLSCLIYVQLQILGVQVSPVGSKVVQKVIVAFEKTLCAQRTWLANLTVL